MRKLLEIKTFVEDFFNIKDISIINKKNKYILARRVYYYIAIELEKYTHEQASDFINQDRSTGTYALQKLKDEMDIYAEMKMLVNKITNAWNEKTTELKQNNTMQKKILNSTALKKHGFRLFSSVKPGRVYYIKDFNFLNVRIQATEDIETLKFDLIHNGFHILEELPESVIIELLYYLYDLEKVARDIANVQDILIPFVSKHIQRYKAL